MRQCRDEDDALAVGESGTREAADGAVEKVLVLVELDDMVAGRRHQRQRDATADRPHDDGQGPWANL